MLLKTCKLDRVIAGEVILGNGMYQHLEELCALGTRFPGTPGEKQAQQLIISKLRSYGLEPVIEEFEHLGWQRISSQLEVISPVSKELVAVSLAGAPSTPAEGIEGEILFLGNGTPREFEEQKENIKDRIVLVTSLSPRCECSPPRQCHRRTKYGRAVAYGAKAFIFMNSQPGMLPQTGSTRQNMEGEIPAVTVPFEEGQLLLHHLARGPVRVRMQTVNRFFPNRTGNIVAEIKGKNRDQIVIIGGHYDCHDNAPGAIDNGSGVVVLLELARIFAQSDVTFEKTIRFVFFAVEEMASVGSSFYVVRHKDELDKIDLFINVDGVGHQGAKTFDTQGFEDVSEYVLSVAREFGYQMKIPQPSFAGDSISFVMGGVPTAALRRARSSPGLFGHEVLSSGEDRGWGHTPADTIDKVRPHDLYESAIIAGLTLLRAAQHQGKIARTRSHSEVSAVLRRHGMDEVLRFMNWPTIPVEPKHKNQVHG